MDQTYEDQVYQSVLKRIEELPSDYDYYVTHDIEHARVTDCRLFLQRIGITRAVLDTLPCIHVAGTKGKGSTCAMTETILRECGYKTGLFCSPPLTEARERIQINGVPLSRGQFGKYATECFALLEANKAQSGPTVFAEPGPYSMFGLMAFYALIKEKVDVAIIETGLGGEYDFTNCLWTPTVTGVSSLGIDHVDTLGKTIDKIAWHKAGIFKEGRPAFTVTQEEDAMRVIIQRAQEKQASLNVCPPLKEFGSDIKLGLVGTHQAINAALAVQLARTWLEEKNPDTFKFADQILQRGSSDKPNSNGVTTSSESVTFVRNAPVFQLPEQFLQGLATCKWPGRNQIIRKDNVTYFLDIAHTKESMQFCAGWFQAAARTDTEGVAEDDIKRVLIFYLGGGRDPMAILPKLVEYGFDGVIFCVPRIVSDVANEVKDYKVTRTLDDYVSTCTDLRSAFEELHEKTHSHCVTMTNGESGSHRAARKPLLKVTLSATQAIHRLFGSANGSSDNAFPGDQGSDGLDDRSDDWKGLASAERVQILVTGSSFIVGSVLRVIDPAWKTFRD